MELTDREPPMMTTNLCEWCGGIGTSRCGRCHSVYYCSREHQMLHWTLHKKLCKEGPPPEKTILLTMNPQQSTPQQANQIYQNWGQDMIPSNTADLNQLITTHNQTTGFTDSQCDVTPQKVLDFQLSDEAMFSSLSSELLSSDNNFWELINPCNTQNISEFTYLNKTLSSQPQAEFCPTYQDEQNYQQYPIVSEISPSEPPEPEMECAPLSDICATIIHDMNKFGICVLDNFIGSSFGNLVFEEVKNLYYSGVFKKGQVVNPKPNKSKESVRCDLMTWVDGTEPNCKHIGDLVRKLDVVLTSCNKMPNNGQFSKYKLHRRTKAMIACYPGDGTYYKRHIDNPHKDGRCITCIYYLNQNWDTKTQGGLLRMFPSADDSQVANIEPIFDRMLFFWSDKRNPHEVLPAYDTRFAITVWYFDADERDQALALFRKRASINRKHASVR